MMRTDMKISTYQLIAVNGKPIRKATKVILNNGKEIKFMERMTKKEAIRQVLKYEKI